MSYRGSGYRGPGDRSRSPPRFGGDRRPSAASIFDNRHSGPPRNASDAPRGPRSQSQFDGPTARGPPPSGLNSGGAPPRTLRDAPPLGTGDRARPPFRDRDYSDRRDRSPPPPPLLRERSPPRKFNEPRDFPPRDIDVRSARRASRDGPLSAGSSYSDNPQFSSSSNFRGAFSRGRPGRGGGDFFDRGSSRGGRRGVDDRADLFRRDRSPPPRFGRDLSRDGREPDRREPDRRDERRFDRRDDDRRSEWLDREREIDRPPRRDPLPSRLETRPPNDSITGTSATYQSAQVLPINPERLAIIESSGADPTGRRPSSAQAVPPTARREPPSETPAHIIARADSTAHRYGGSRGSSPPTQAPPVPAFSFSVTATSASSQPAQATRLSLDAQSSSAVGEHTSEDPKPPTEDKPAPPANAPTAPRALPAPKTHHASPPPIAPRAPRALEVDSATPSSNRLQGVRSLDNLSGQNQQPVPDSSTIHATTMPPSPTTTRPPLSHLAQSFSPNPASVMRFTDLAAPTGPKASRVSPALPATSPRPPFTSPRSDVGLFHGTSVQFQRGQTPPPLAPSGPRRQSFSVSPKVVHSNVPTAPRAGRVPPVAPRASERVAPPSNPSLQRPTGMPPFAPSGPRGHMQWNQWRRPGVSVYSEKPGSTIPSKRDHSGEEKENQDRMENVSATDNHNVEAEVKEEQSSHHPDSRVASNGNHSEQMDIDSELARRKPTLAEGHSAAQSFFGKTLEKPEDDVASSSDEDESDEEGEGTLLEAKHARQERELRSRMYDLSVQDYRGTSSLESIARLFRLSEKDMERLKSQREDEMDVDGAILATNRLMPPMAQSSEIEDCPDILTPQGEDVSGGTVREPGKGIDSVRRICRTNLRPVPLPYLLKGQETVPLQESKAFLENIRVLEESEPDIVAELEKAAQDDDDSEVNTNDVFEEIFKQWRLECEEMDREREEQEKLERQQSAEPGPEPDAPASLAINPILEGRRLHKYSSEYALEQVLKQSEETARVEKEKAEREAMKTQADMEKEARLPDHQSREKISRSVLIDANRLRDPKSLTLVFSYEPPADDFDEHEQQIFIAAFKESPKKWGEIASLLPKRTYEDCIRHYYTNKWDGRFRDNRAKKFKGGRRGRGGKARPSRGSALMADLNRGEDLVSTNDSSTGRPKRAAAPTTFGEKEIEAKGSLLGQSPAKKITSAKEGNGDGTEKKRRKTEGSKSGRKAKTQPAIIAAAPSTTSNKPGLPGAHSKEDLVRAQTLEEAGLLANLQGGHQGVPHTDIHMVFNQEGFIPQRSLADDGDRPKPTTAQRPGASSYWSVPEQTDFYKYIDHFGTDFGAIASHMGTKTQTMIKNHYQRQIDGGRSAELEESANKANARRQRGEDIGPPPTPTPIVKRRYDNPQSNTPRALAPQADAMETDEPTPPTQQLSSKHVSPPQPAAHVKPRYPTSAQNTPVPPRVIPSPLAVTSAPMSVPLPPAPHSRGVGHPLGARFHLLGEARGESRPGMQSNPGFRMPQEDPAIPRSQPPQSQPPPPQPIRTPSGPIGHVPDPQYLHSLREEQERAIRMQSDLRHDQFHGHVRHEAGQTPRTHGSPVNQPMTGPIAERKPIMEERVPTPPRGSFFPPGPSRHPMFGSSAPSLQSSATPLSSLTARNPYNPSPPKPDMSRPGSVPTPASIQPTPSHTPAPMPAPAPAPAVTPAPEPPKRSNLLSILNSDPEEPVPTSKRDSLPSATTLPASVASPASGVYPPTSASQSVSNGMQQRREPFGQPALSGSQAHFQRPSYGQSHAIHTPPASLKHEALSGTVPQQPPAANEWSSRVFHQGSQPSPSMNPASLDREASRYYQPNRSMLGSIGGATRVVPSPPPHLHSRTPSLTTQQALPLARDQRTILGGPPPGTSQATHSNPYGAPQQLPPYSQTPALNHGRSHHNHNTSMTEGSSILPRFGQPAHSREDLLRSEDERANARKHEEHDPYRRRFDAPQTERPRDSRDHYLTQREHETERQRQQQQQHAYPRGPLPPHPQQMQPPGSYESPFSQPSRGAGYGIREQSARDTELMMQHEHRLREENERKRQEQNQMTYMRDRREDFFPRRTTPYGGPSYPPPPPPSRR